LGQTVSVSTCGGRTPLAIAAEHGRPRLVELLLENGARSDIADNNGSLPIELVESALVLTSSEAKRTELNAVRTLLLRSMPLSSSASRALPSVDEVKVRQQVCEQLLRERSRVARQTEQARRIADDVAVVAAKYKPLHDDVYSWSPPPPSSSIDAAVEVVDGYGLFTLPMFDASFCQHVIDEIVHYEREAKKLALPLFYRHDDNIGSLERCGFRALLDRLAEHITPLLARLTCAATNCTHALRARHAFVTRNYVGRAAVANFKTHRDKSDVTLNVCIERTDDVEGSTVSFFGSGRGITVVGYMYRLISSSYLSSFPSLSLVLNRRRSQPDANEETPRDDQRVLDYSHALGVAGNVLCLTACAIRVEQQAQI
jgi:hypothetical protein